MNGEMALCNERSQKNNDWSFQPFIVIKVMFQNLAGVLGGKFEFYFIGDFGLRKNPYDLPVRKC